MKLKLKRIRPGLYHLVDDGGYVRAEIERGGETQRWYYVATKGDEHKCDFWYTLKNAAASARRWLG